MGVRPGEMPGSLVAMPPCVLQSGSQCCSGILHETIHCVLSNPDPDVELSLQSTSFLHDSSWFLCTLLFV
jgi:hypothetical protein